MYHPGDFSDAAGSLSIRSDSELCLLCNSCTHFGNCMNTCRPGSSWWTDLHRKPPLIIVINASHDEDDACFAMSFGLVFCRSFFHLRVLEIKKRRLEGPWHSIAEFWDWETPIECFTWLRRSTFYSVSGVGFWAGVTRGKGQPKSTSSPWASNAVA